MDHIRACLLVLVLVFPGAVFPADLEALTEDCGGCHGVQGVSGDGDLPTIAGQDADFIRQSLVHFQGRERPCRQSAYRQGDTSRPATTMCNIAAALSEEDIAAVSEYYSSQTFVAAQQAFEPALSAAGETVHASACESCHPQGGSVPGLGPILAGQWLPYLRSATEQALNGELLIPPIMDRELLALSSADIDAVLNYYASQQP